MLQVFLSDFSMNNTHDLHDKRLADAWATLKAHAEKGLPSIPILRASPLPIPNSCCAAKPAASACSSS